MSTPLDPIKEEGDETNSDTSSMIVEQGPQNNSSDSSMATEDLTNKPSDSSMATEDLTNKPSDSSISKSDWEDLANIAGQMKDQILKCIGKGGDSNIKSLTEENVLKVGNESAKQSGGKKKRQTRKKNFRGGKRYRRKSRRFR
jgi:hypothetical protein